MIGKGTMTGLALDDLRVLRIGDSAAGAFLDRLLTEQGATVDRAASLDPAALSGVDVLVTEGGSPDLRESHPALVHCVLTGVPEGAPVGADAGLDDRALAAVLGLHRMSGEPVAPDPLPVVSYYGALMACVYVTAAIFRRGRDGRGTALTVPLVSAALTVLSRDLVFADDPELVDIALNPHLPNVHLYRCADGRWLQPHGLYGSFVAILCEVLGHPEWIDTAVPALHSLPDKESVAVWKDRFAAEFRTRPALEWEQLINDAGGVATMVRSREEWAAETHPYHADILSTEDAAATRAVRVQPLSDAAGTPWELPAAPGGLPLSGVRVVDFCIVLAGPTCGRILAELGADVVKVDDPFRYISPFPWLDVNRSKRSIVLDLTKPEGVDIARRLVADADVVVQNFRAGKIDRLGFGRADVTRDRPELVYASLNAFDYDGDWQHRPGWEHNAQAASGMQVNRQRGDVPGQVPYPVNDYATGLSGAFGVLLGLRLRQRTGTGAWIRASLVRSATYIQRNGTPESDFRPVDGGTGTRWVSSASGASVPETTGPLDPAIRPWLFDAGLYTRWQHPVLGWIEQVTPRPAGTDLHRADGWPAPQPGADTVGILTELGLTPSEIESLYAAAVTHPERDFRANP
jgi:crotonobetainyl-CoA:carnitine CoA-transferase CaiB-like acyl-CoA transferase